MKKLSLSMLFVFGILASEPVFAGHVKYVCTGKSYGDYKATWDDRWGGTGRLVVLKNGQTLASLNPAGIVFEPDHEDSNILHCKGGSISNYFIDFAIRLNTPVFPQPDAYLGIYGGIDNAEADHLQLSCVTE